MVTRFLLYMVGVDGLATFVSGGTGFSLGGVNASLTRGLSTLMDQE